MKIEDFKDITEEHIATVKKIYHNDWCSKYCDTCPFSYKNSVNKKKLCGNSSKLNKYLCKEFLELTKDYSIKEENTNPKLIISDTHKKYNGKLYELEYSYSSVNMDTNKGSDVYKFVDNSVEKCITNYPRLLGLMQYGLFITQMDGHLYIDVNYECVTSETEELQEKIKDKGITFISKVYEGYDEALDRVDNLLEALGMKKLTVVGNYLIENKKQGE